MCIYKLTGYIKIFICLKLYKCYTFSGSLTIIHKNKIVYFGYRSKIFMKIRVLKYKHIHKLTEYKKHIYVCLKLYKYYLFKDSVTLVLIKLYSSAFFINETQLNIYSPYIKLHAVNSLNIK